VDPLSWRSFLICCCGCCWGVGCDGCRGVILHILFFQITSPVFRQITRNIAIVLHEKNNGNCGIWELSVPCSDIVRAVKLFRKHVV
jgi:hypothetical protein